MKKYILIILFAVSSFIGQAQSFDFQFDHFAIVVEDLAESAEFYGNILNLKETPHPDKKPGFRWFLVNGTSQVHLIHKEFAPFEKNKSMHLCLATEDLEAVMAHFEKNNITYSDWPGKEGAVSLRTDGVRQIYVQDPDEYWIEINTAKH